MPTTIKKKTYRRKRPYRKKRGYRRRKANPVAHIKIPTVGLPYNMSTYLRFMSKTYNYLLPTDITGPPPTFGANNMGFSIGLNYQNPLNMLHVAGAPPSPMADNLYFGTAPQFTSEGAPGEVASSTYSYSQLVWWAQWYHKMRISHVWVTTIIRPVQDAAYSAPQPGNSSRWPITVSVLDAKYISQVNTPQTLLLMNDDDFRASRGVKTYTISGQRYKPLIIKRKISIARLLNVKDLKDTGYETQCQLDPGLNSNGSFNPTIRYTGFEFLKISIQSGQTPLPTNAVWAYSIQWQITAACHFSQLRRNNPTSLFLPTDGVTVRPENQDDPNPAPPPSGPV